MLSLLLVSASFISTDSAYALKLAERLESLQAVAFRYRRDLNYGSDGYKHTLEANVHIVFDKSALPLLLIYAARGKDFFDKFDGHSYTRTGDATIKEDFPKATYFDSQSVLKNSLVGLAPALRAAIANIGAKVSSTRTDNGLVSLRIVLNEKEFGISKPLIEVGYFPTYEILVGTNGMPAKIVHQLKDPRDTITTTFDKYDLKASRQLPD
ncbi:MAG: hypothetical protein H7Y17_06320 [Chlorobia bacterium]|nr:hypothetical protein [Fimbriimonadaceae bacterium]